MQSEKSTGRSAINQKKCNREKCNAIRRELQYGEVKCNQKRSAIGRSAMQSEEKC
ncbi:hypothetical protein A2U01_0114957, partial [Trifolium medium]|nr:hypothetical protein [Trifolium medium]